MDCRCIHIQRLSGGMINTVLRLQFDRHPYQVVIKLNQQGTSFIHETRALEYLATYTRFPSPEVYAHDPTASLVPYSYLLLEDLPGECLHGIEISQGESDLLDEALVDVLVDLHAHRRDTFGGIDDAAGASCWVDIFLPRILSVRCEEQVNRRLSKTVLKEVDEAIHKIDRVFEDQGEPVLVHGDIWAGNIIVKKENNRWRLSGIVDPALQYADVEYELAYLESFNNPRPAFFQKYLQRQSLRPGYQVRRLFYWLHTYLIHVWLFGDRYYCELAAETASRIKDLE
jgi:fructosamine-3-kinase